jgi:hypothetical protein
MKHEPARNVLVAAVVTEAAAGAVVVRGAIRRKPYSTNNLCLPQMTLGGHVYFILEFFYVG